jgi:hypothetical protein
MRTAKNDFEIELLEKFTNFTPQDFDYCTDETIIKIESLGLPNPACSIMQTFVNANHADFLRKEYCLKNCGFKCLTGRIKL